MAKYCTLRTLGSFLRTPGLLYFSGAVGHLLVDIVGHGVRGPRSSHPIPCTHLKCSEIIGLISPIIARPKIKTRMRSGFPENQIKWA